MRTRIDVSQLGKSNSINVRWVIGKLILNSSRRGALSEDDHHHQINVDVLLASGALCAPAAMEALIFVKAPSSPD